MLRVIPSSENIRETNAELKELEYELVELKEILKEWTEKISEDGQYLEIIVNKTQTANQDIKDGTAALERTEVIAKVKREKRLKTTLIAAGIAGAIGGALAGPIGGIISWKLAIVTAGIGIGAGAGVGTMLTS